MSPNPASTTFSHSKNSRAHSHDKVVFLERRIDAMEVDLPRLTKFILPGGGLASAHLHVARSAARAAERRIVPLVARESVEGVVGRFVNRLSDFFFVAARYVAFVEGEEEVEYKKKP